jgi:hypothetical protein
MTPVKFILLNIYTHQRICVAIVLLITFNYGADAAEHSIRPTIAVSEEYTDNVFETRANKRGDFITRILPGIDLKYKAPLWDWGLEYFFDYRYYAKGSRNDDTTHNINAKGLVKIIDEKLFLEVSDVYKRVSLDVSRDTTNESLFLNQSDQNVGTVSPYLVLRPNPRLTVRTGYRYINTWYKDPQAISRQDHAVFIDSAFELSPKFFLTSGYTFTREEASRNSLYRHEAYIGPRYEYAEKSFIFAQGGAIISDYDNRAETVNPSWNAGITHTFDTMTATLSTGVKYSEDPLSTATLETTYAATITRNLKQGMVTLLGSYSEFSDATTDILNNKRYSGGFTSHYEILQDLRGSLGLTYEYYTNEPLAANTRKYFVDSGLNYTMGKDITIGLTYRYIDYSSEKIAIDNKQVNRAILEVRKVF